MIIVAVAETTTLEGLTFHEFSDENKADIFKEIWNALGYFTNKAKKES